MAKEITARKRSERWRREQKIRDKATAYLEYTQRLIKLRRKEK
jgi:hypothetical protein